MRAISNKGWAEWASLIFCSLRTNCLEYKCRITSRFHIHLYIPLSFLFLKWLACEIALQRDWASRHNEYSGTVWGFLTIFIALLWDRLVDMKENGLTRKILTWNKQISGSRSRNCAITTLWIVKNDFTFLFVRQVGFWVSLWTPRFGIVGHLKVSDELETQKSTFCTNGTFWKVRNLIISELVKLYELERFTKLLLYN